MLQKLVLTIVIVTSAVVFGASSKIDLPIGCDFANKKAAYANGQKASPRPDADEFIDSDVFPIRVHFQNGVERSYANKILSYAEISWSKLFIESKFYTPHPDGDLGGGEGLFDLYIITDMMEGVGGYAGFSGFYEQTPRQDAFGYLVIANDLNSILVRGVVAHELFHVSQMAYDWWEDISFMEGSAVWAGDHVFPDENIAWRYYTFYNKQPWMVLDFISLANPYQYGTGMFYQFLDEVHGNNDGSFVRKLWEGSIQDTMENEPDFMDAAEILLAAKGSNFSDAFKEFGAYRIFLGERNDGMHFMNAHRWTGWSKTIDPYVEAVMHEGVKNISGVTSPGPQQFSHVFFEVFKPEDKLLKIRFKTKGDARFGLVVYEKTTDGWQEKNEFSLNEEYELLIDNKGKSRYVLILSQLGDGSYDSDTSEWKTQNVSYDFSIEGN